MKIGEIQEEINMLKENGKSVGELSDGYHTFNELYKHRCILTAALFRMVPYTWKAKVHDDRTMFDGMFIVGVCTPEGHATYHYDLPDWDLFKVPEIPHAPKFDGHTPEDAINRIKNMFTKGILMFSQEESERLSYVVSDILDCFESDAEKEAYLKIFLKE